MFNSGKTVEYDGTGAQLPADIEEELKQFCETKGITPDQAACQGVRMLLNAEKNAEKIRHAEDEARRYQNRVNDLEAKLNRARTALNSQISILERVKAGG